MRAHRKISGSGSDMKQRFLTYSNQKQNKRSVDECYTRDLNQED